MIPHTHTHIQVAGIALGHIESYGEHSPKQTASQDLLGVVCVGAVLETVSCFDDFDDFFNVLFLILMLLQCRRRETGREGIWCGREHHDGARGTLRRHVPEKKHTSPIN